MINNIPKPLINQIKEGNVVLFLGAGAAFGCKLPKEKKALTGKELANKIADEYLEGNYENADLQYVSELAISETDLRTVQKFIADIFKEYKPGEQHLAIPQYTWHSIFTTNYDLIVEEAYNKAQSKSQHLATFIKKFGKG